MASAIVHPAQHHEARLALAQSADRRSVEGAPDQVALPTPLQKTQRDLLALDRRAVLGQRGRRVGEKRAINVIQLARCQRRRIHPIFAHV